MSEIETIKGNLLDFPQHNPNDPDKHIGINVIAHSCNTRMIMGGGIARQIKSRYPQAYEADVKYISNEYDDNGQFIHPLGNFSKAEVNSKESKVYLPDGKGLIYNMYTQNSIGKGREVNYEGFYDALCNVADHIEWQDKHDSTTSSLGLPWGISCGLAGGSWGIIFAIINEILVDRKFKTYIVKYNE